MVLQSFIGSFSSAWFSYQKVYLTGYTLGSLKGVAATVLLWVPFKVPLGVLPPRVPGCRDFGFRVS